MQQQFKKKNVWRETETEMNGQTGRKVDHMPSTNLEPKYLPLFFSEVLACIYLTLYGAGKF